jgi:hypothetical protein
VSFVDVRSSIERIKFEYLQGRVTTRDGTEAMNVCLLDALLPHFIIPAKEARPGRVAGRTHMHSKRRHTAQSPDIRVKGSLPGGAAP